MVRPFIVAFVATIVFMGLALAGLWLLGVLR